MWLKIFIEVTRIGEREIITDAIVLRVNKCNCIYNYMVHCTSFYEHFFVIETVFVPIPTTSIKNI